MTLRQKLDLARSKDLTLATFLERFAEVQGDAPLVEEDGDGLKLSYAEAGSLVARWAGAIRPRISAGDAVVIALPNGYGLFLACLATARAGGVAVPVNPKMQPHEIEHIIADSGASVVVREAAELDGAQPVPAAPAEPGDVAVLFYTSGTTGKPKGAQLSHRALVGASGPMALFPSGLLRQECVSGLPVAHVAGFSMLVQMAGLGVPVYLMRKFRPDEALDAIETRRATMFIGVPAMYRMMLEAGAEQRDLSSIRLWSSGADVMPTELAKRYQRMGGTITVPFLGRTVGMATFTDGYGMVELGGGAALRVLPPLPAGDGLIVPMRGNSFKVVDEVGELVEVGEVGELVVKGPGIMRGYHGKEDATRETLTADGWLRTGDLARRKRFGRFAFAGRKKDVIKVGGYSVFAVEVEAVLEEHPGIREAAVVGLADERKGEVPAAVVIRAEDSSVTAEEVTAWASERLSGYKVPQQVRFADSLPRTGTDKVQKQGLADLFG